MEKVNFKPLGSLIRINGTSQKFIIVARGVNLTIGDKKYYFDYGCVKYPDGFDGKNLAYINDKDIYEVVCSGYSDADDEYQIKQINLKLESSDAKYTDIKEIVKDFKHE